MEDKQKLGKQIKEQRTKVNYSQRELALKCGITPQSLSDIEKGINLPSVTVFMKLVENINFDDKEKIYDLYGDIKKTVPPDIIKLLTTKKEIIKELREKIKRNKGE